MEKTFIRWAVISIFRSCVLLLTGIFLSCASTQQDFQSEHAYDGLSFYNVRGSNIIKLENTDGSTYHEWILEGVSERFNYPLILAGGRLLYVDFNGIIGILDSASEKIWEKNLGAHHDADLIATDQIITFNRKARYLPKKDLLVTDELITILAATDGKILKQISLFEALENSLDIDALLENVWETQHSDDYSRYYLSDGSYNMFHANSISVLRRDYNTVFTKGRVLISIRNLNLLVLLDIESEKIIWHWGSDVLDHQHYPVVTGYGNVMVYDNGLATRDFSRILEIDPFSGEVLWAYNISGNEGFHSGVMGSAQPLPNGNILITESVHGRIFEILRNGTVVQEIRTSNRVYRFEKFEKTLVDAVMNNELASNRELFNISSE